MADYGDLFPIQSGLSTDTIGIPMSTAICRIYTKDGFLIAADGRMRCSADGSINDATQKIFPFEQERTLSYCCFGLVRLGSAEQEGEIVFDFKKAVDACA